MMIVLAILALAGCTERRATKLVPYKVTFESGRIDTLYADEWTGLMYDAEGRRVRCGKFETSTSLAK